MIVGGRIDARYGATAVVSMHDVFCELHGLAVEQAARLAGQATPQQL
jgi:hypothetical protein